MSKQCKCGSEQKPDAPGTFIVWKREILPGSDRIFGGFGENNKQPDTVYGIHDVYNTTDFCSKAPEITAQGDLIRQTSPLGYELLRQVLYERWGQHCRCKHPCSEPPFKGGRCAIEYYLEYKMTNAAGRIFSSRGQWSLMGPIARFEVTDTNRFGQPEWIITMYNTAGRSNFRGEYKSLGQPYDIRPVPWNSNQIDNCGDPPPIPPSDPLPPPPPILILPPPPVIKPAPPPPPACICPPPKIIEKERIVFRDRIVPRPITIIKKVKECCDLSPIINRLDRLETNVKAHVNIALIMQTKTVVGSIAAALLGQTAAIKVALVAQTAAILLGVAGLIATATGTITALLAVTEKKIVDALTKEIIITGNWVRNNLANTVINPGFENLRNRIINEINRISIVINNLADRRQERIINEINRISIVITTALERVKTSLVNEINRISIVITTALERVKTSLVNEINRISIVITTALERVKTSLVNEINRISIVITTALERVKSELRQALDRVYQELRKEIVSGFVGLLAALATSTGAIMALITAKTAATLAAIATGFTTVNASLAAMRLQLTQLGVTLGLVRNKVDEIDRKLSIDISGELDTSTCDGKSGGLTRYQGQGLRGLAEQAKTIAQLLGLVKTQVCTIKRPDCPSTRIEIKIFRACKVKPTNNQEVADFDLISMEVPQSEAANIKELHDRIFELQSDDCREKTEDCIAAVPEWWQVRLGADRPQLVVQYAEIIGTKKDGSPQFGAPMYALTIPHYALDRDRTLKELFPAYVKGQSMAVLVLDDNSKLILNCDDQSTAEAMVEQLSQVISPSVRQNAHLSIGVRQGQQLKGVTVYPRIAKFFSTGQKDMKPTWIKHFDQA